MSLYLCADLWGCLGIRREGSYRRICPCASWWSCGCTQGTIYSILSANSNSKVDSYSSLFSILANSLLKAKNFSRATPQNRLNTVEVRLVKRQRAGRLLASRDGGGWNEQTWQQSIPKDEAAQD